MDLWQRARGFAEVAAKRSHELTIGAAKPFQDLVAETAKKSKELAAETAKKSKELASETAKKSMELAAETAKKSKELAVEATKTADLLRSEALCAADQIKTLSVADIPIPPAISSALAGSDHDAPGPATVAPDPVTDLETFGITEELREFVKGITISTFRDFPMEDEPEIAEVPTVSNVRQDLNEWQAKHATLVLSSVKEISKFRYELCPRYMKERKFWRIYYVLVNNFVAPYQNKYMEDLAKKAAEKEHVVKQGPATIQSTGTEEKETKPKVKTSSSSTTEHDLDVFLLGDLGSEDDGPDDGENGFDDDFDKIDGTTGWTATMRNLSKQSDQEALRGI